MSKESVKAAEREPESKGLNYRRVTELLEFDYANKLEEGRFREGMEELCEACWALRDGMGRPKAMAYFSRHCAASIVSIVRLPGSAVTCFLSITVIYFHISATHYPYILTYLYILMYTHILI